MSQMVVKVNGAEHALPAGSTVAQLLAALGMDPARVAVERNLEVVPRVSYGEAPLSDGDRLEVVTFVGGGS